MKESLTVTINMTHTHIYKYVIYFYTYMNVTYICYHMLVRVNDQMPSSFSQIVRSRCFGGYHGLQTVAWRFNTVENLSPRCNGFHPWWMDPQKCEKLTFRKVRFKGVFWYGFVIIIVCFISLFPAHFGSQKTPVRVMTVWLVRWERLATLKSNWAVKFCRPCYIPLYWHLYMYMLVCYDPHVTG